MLTGTEVGSHKRVENKERRISGRTSAKLWVAAVLAGIVFLGAWLKYSPRASGSSAGAPPAALPQVVVSKPLAQDIDTRLASLANSRRFRKSNCAHKWAVRLREYFSRMGTLFGRATCFSQLMLDPTNNTC